MKFYIDISDCEALELEGELINKKLEYDRAEEVRTHLNNGVHSTKIINAKGYTEIWEVVKANGDKETLVCITRYENDNYRNRICDKIMCLLLESKDLFNYGEVIDKDLIIK